MICFGLLLTFFIFPTYTYANSLSLSSGYDSKNVLQVGTLVSFDPNSNNQLVVTANVNNANNLVGTVINQNNSNISFSSKNTNLQVGTSGTYLANVSTINGDIHKGDRITASIIEGYGMKALSASRVVGTALNNFSSSSKGATKETLSSDGNKVVYIGQILVSISVSDYSGQSTPNYVNPEIAPFKNFFQSAVNKQVTVNQTVTALAAIFIGLILTVITLTVSIIISVRSIGRNPLARKGITRHTILIIVTVLLILLLSVITAYLILAGN